MLANKQYPLAVVVAHWTSLCVGRYIGVRGPAKFQHFLPVLSESTLSDINNNVCAATRADYMSAYNDPAVDPDRLCLAQQDCILVNMSESEKSYMSSSSLVLGLSPILLSSIGPTISEIGLLSLRRPILSLLLTFGTVGVYPSRILSYVDDSALDIIGEPTTLAVFLNETRVHDTVRKRAAAISVAQYVVVALAVFNVFYTSWQLGVATVLNFVCQSSFMPLVWTTLPAFIHLPAALALRANKKKPATVSTSESTRAMNCSKSLIRPSLTSEVTLHAMREEPIDLAALRPTPMLIFWRWVATVLSFVHVLVGIVIFSSLLFTMTTDAAIILLRYAASALACRLIIIFELGGIRWSRAQAQKNERMNATAR
ncbi:hypothetical protein PFICI_12715 [Pestalotiopsis fici W106-1]|uniref:Uncharacterized protein n=1 Tax=Pestalotiopsis fici (strain W106-1 / CGMCC3.15140) TaxID=1229662 RepID=W3WSG8_PESFW|nr:uncharacterized protein PFICI_12715 [Pestalotiopsis fici W106-1]ETS75771.1 hypothetical protein PFICI_12715 [Pestalotiopsis fici W106-1]